MMRSFLRLAVFTVLPLIVASGCQKKQACDGKGVAATISGNHGHTVTIPDNRLNDLIGGTYPVRGGTHEHVVTLKDADMKALAEGQTVTTLASSVNAHTHEITFACAP
jgi:hypothetical protein